MADIQTRKKRLNKRPNIYNICVNCYPSFKAVAADFERISAMGFDTIWFLPFLEPGLDTAVKRKIEGESEHGEEFWMCGSLYAATYKSYEIPGEGKRYYVLNLSDPKTPFSSMPDGVERNNQAIKDVIAMIDEAKRWQLTPMFDLVLNHVSIDSPLRQGDTAKFFCEKPHQKFNDVVGFKYDTFSKEIFVQFWEPVIDWFIITLGFEGVRIDALAWVHPNILDRAIGPIVTKFKREGIENPIVFGEIYGEMFGPSSILDRPSIKHLKEKRCAGRPLLFSHFMNTTNEIPPLSIPPYDDRGFSVYDDRGWAVALAKEIVIKRYLLPVNAGGTIGAPGTHDRLTLREKCEEVKKGATSSDIIKLMKEKILMTVIGSDGGWFLMGGDEFGTTLVKQPPFLYKGAQADSAEYLTDKAIISAMQYRYQDCPLSSQLERSQYDLTEFITAVNNELSKKIRYETLTPLCKFIQYKQDGKLLFVAIGNFVGENIGGFIVGDKHYIAIDLSEKGLKVCCLFGVDKSEEILDEHGRYKNWVLDPLKEKFGITKEKTPSWPGPKSRAEFAAFEKTVQYGETSAPQAPAGAFSDPQPICSLVLRKQKP